jgi:hypothetical protein
MGQTSPRLSASCYHIAANGSMTRSKMLLTHSHSQGLGSRRSGPCLMCSGRTSPKFVWWEGGKMPCTADSDTGQLWRDMEVTGCPQSALTKIIGTEHLDGMGGSPRCGGMNTVHAHSPRYVCPAMSLTHKVFLTNHLWIPSNCLLRTENPQVGWESQGIYKGRESQVECPWTPLGLAVPGDEGYCSPGLTSPHEEPSLDKGCKAWCRSHTFRSSTITLFSSTHSFPVMCDTIFNFSCSFCWEAYRRKAE